LVANFGGRGCEFDAIVWANIRSRGGVASGWLSDNVPVLIGVVMVLVALPCAGAVDTAPAAAIVAVSSPAVFERKSARLNRLMLLGDGSLC